MIMSAALRKFILTVHITCSVGWIGAVITYLVLVIAAITRQDFQILRAAWLAMALIGWFGIVPLSLTATLTGLIIALGTKWGLFRHYWVLLSLVMTIFATLILLQHMPSVTFFANIAAQGNNADMSRLRAGLDSELFHAGVGLVLLFVIQVLNVYKPRGMTPYGWRKQHEQQ
jgi:hypothetical protein